MRLQTRVILWVLGIILLATTVTLALTMLTLVWRIRRSMERSLFEVADTVAGLSEVRSGLRGSPFDGVVHDRVLKISASFSGIDSLVVCDQQRRYFSSPNVFQLGLLHDDRDADDVVSMGERYVKITNTLQGEMIRAYVPVFSDGEQVGFVECGALSTKLKAERDSLFLTVGTFLLVGMSVGAVGAVFQARKIKRILLGLEPEAIAKLYYEHAGMIEAMHEGVIAVNEQGVVSMSNESARKLLAADGTILKDSEIRHVMPGTRIPEVLQSGEPQFDYEQRVRDRVVISNIVPIRDSGRIVGVVETLQDKTQVVRMAEELTGIKQLVEALRASSHEFSNKMQVVLGMLEMEDCESAKEFILGTQATRGGLEKRLVQSFANPMIAGLLLGKSSAAVEQGVTLTISPESRLGTISDPAISHELVTIIGNLVDNAMESARKRGDGKGEVALEVFDAGGTIRVRVWDNGEGIRAKTMDSIFLRGFSTKGENRGTGLYLVRQAVGLLGGTIDVESRPGSTAFTVAIPLAEGGEG